MRLWFDITLLIIEELVSKNVISATAPVRFRSPLISVSSWVVVLAILVSSRESPDPSVLNSFVLLFSTIIASDVLETLVGYYHELNSIKVISVS